MKRKVFTRTMAFLITVMMALGLAACGSPAETESPATTGEQDPARVEVQKQPSDTNKVTPVDYTISILTISHDGRIISDKHPNFATLKEHTGYNVKLEFLLDASYQEQLNTRLASGNLPGLVVITGNTGPIVSAIKAGAFWDITDVYKDYPNLAVADEDVLRNISVGGRIYGIYRSRVVGRYGISYRSDWLKNLGMKEPKTLDDLYNVLRAFTYDDPDRNGKDDTYGMTWCVYNGPFNILATMHGAPNMWGVDQNNKLYPWFESDAYVEAMDFCKRLYDEGLINRDFAALQTGDWMNDFATGKSGLWIDVADTSTRLATALRDNGLMTKEQYEAGEMVWVMGPVANAKGDKKIMVTTGNAGYVAISKNGAPTEADMKHYLTFMDRCNDEIGQNILNYGTEGITYDRNSEGFITMLTADEIVKRGGTGTDVVSGWNQFMMNTVDLLYKQNTNPRQIQHEKVFKENLNYAVHNPVIALTSETYIAKGSTLEQLLKDATVNYIMGRIDKAGFEKEVQRWYSEGGQTALNEFQASYDETKK
jgi:putative aldouronate transport system substrate-binding protein